MEKLRRIIKSAWLQHLLFWVLSFYFIGSYFSISNEFKIIDFIYAAFFHIPLLVLVYLNLRYHIPAFLQKEKYLIYFLLSAFNVAAAYFLHQVVFDFLIPILPGDFYMVSFTEPSVLITIFLIYLVITTLLKLSKSWYQLQQVEKEKLSLELNSLKMQINPHFLFNSLNSIYSLARKKSNDAPDAILELSNLMRYMIYEVKDEEVPLSKEISAIKHYLHLQKLRVEKDAVISLDITNTNEQQMIAPLLFFPLLENCFKHGLKNVSNNYVEIRIENDPSHLVFEARNNKGQTEDLEKGRYGGIGLENVRKRLHLIYGQRSLLDVRDSPDDFRVKLTIQWYD